MVIDWSWNKNDPFRLFAIITEDEGSPVNRKCTTCGGTGILVENEELSGIVSYKRCKSCREHQEKITNASSDCSC